jgi:hypothetical protein
MMKKESADREDRLAMVTRRTSSIEDVDQEDRRVTKRRNLVEDLDRDGLLAATETKMGNVDGIDRDDLLAKVATKTKMGNVDGGRGDLQMKAATMTNTENDDPDDRTKTERVADLEDRRFDPARNDVRNHVMAKERFDDRDLRMKCLKKSI